MKAKGASLANPTRTTPSRRMRSSVGSSTPAPGSQPSSSITSAAAQQAASRPRAKDQDLPMGVKSRLATWSGRGGCPQKGSTRVFSRLL